MKDRSIETLRPELIAAFVIARLRISGQIGLRAPVHGHRLGHRPRLNLL
jgi:hypothetical protein